MTRIAVVDKTKCNSEKCAWLCVSLCPINRAEKDCILEGKDNKIIINEEVCTGCGICPQRCPFDAISIINLPEELNNEPIHRFGENGFALYRIPIPQNGKVVGILGRNGIGKSTALNILSGELKPNLGRKVDADFADVVKHFKGTEAQTYFEKVHSGNIKVAYKPQKVDEIPKHFKGTVKELLEKVDETGELKKITQELEIDKILNHDISKISGGELQTVAIAATALKKADVYYFDEPTSYLDIKKRLQVAKFIRTLANEETSVIVVEHDLIILDYMTDVIHLMYGKQSCYGVVSQPMASKAGVNAYLGGYLKSENVRFRDKQIKFEVRAPPQAISEKQVANWPKFKKSFTNFKLESEEGEINSHQVTGILGQNGIGKTTFVKVLAGVDEHDDGKMEMELKVAYKPQYIASDSEELVITFLAEAISNHPNDVIGPLDIEPLFTKKICELSGGELQKVAIAFCLGQDADIYLFDEPSAYLDVEQRLRTSRIINDFMANNGKSALVVDHDILFIDYLSHKLLVFEGEPSIKGFVHKPEIMEKGMNKLLKELKITLRREEETGRPRINKEESVKDRAQKKAGKYYYS